MKKEIIVRLSKSFEETVHVEQGVEYWMARDLQKLFEYSYWDNFLNVIEKAKTACYNSNMLINSHFRDVTKMANYWVRQPARNPGYHAVSLCMLSDCSKWGFS